MAEQNTNRRPTIAEIQATEAIARATFGHDLNSVLWMFANVIVAGLIKADIPQKDIVIANVATGLADRMHSLAEQAQQGQASAYLVKQTETLQ